MKTLIMYYSYSGSTKALANEKAEELGADIEEIFEAKRPFMPIGIHRAVNRIRTEISPTDREVYDMIDDCLYQVLGAEGLRKIICPGI